VNDIQTMHREGISISQISALTGFDRKTVRKYLRWAQGIPRYGPRAVGPGKLDAYRQYLEARLTAGVWNGVVLLRELRERGYQGGYTLLKDFLRPRRRAAKEVAVRRFETPPGKQAQVDWGHIGLVEDEQGRRRALWGFVFTLGYSRAMAAGIATDQRLETLLAMHEEAFRQLGGVPKEILYDRMKTVVLDIDERGEIRWHPVFLDFSRWWGFTPRLCHAYRPQTKGKVESGIRYLKGNFLCGREAGSVESLRTQLGCWIWQVANQRVHGTTGRVIAEALAQEQPYLQPLSGRRCYPFVAGLARKAGRDAYVQYRTNRYSVPWQVAGQPVQVQAVGGRLSLYCEGEPIATHEESIGRHQMVTDADHHRGLPVVSSRRPERGKIYLQIAAPEVEARPLERYELCSDGGRR